MRNGLCFCVPMAHKDIAEIEVLEIGGKNERLIHEERWNRLELAVVSFL